MVMDGEAWVENLFQINCSDCSCYLVRPGLVHRLRRQCPPVQTELIKLEKKGRFVVLMMFRRIWTFLKTDLSHLLPLWRFCLVKLWTWGGV